MTKSWEVCLPSRVIFKIPLRPILGDRFQPTSFPDVGPAEYVTPEGVLNLGVESPQSVANRLEAAIWDEAEQDLVAPLRGMPYIRQRSKEHGLITSLSEPHRTASPYLLPAIKDRLIAEWGWDHKRQLSLGELAPTLLRYDPNALVHGVFFVMLKPGNLKVPRLVSSFIQASRVTPAISGGVKFDHVNPKGEAEVGKGHIPFSRREYVSPDIFLAFSIDLVQLRRYRLSKLASSFLHDLSLYKLRLFLDQGLRLRTACDFEVLEEPDLPSEKTLAERLSKAIGKLRKSGEFAAAPGIWDLA